MWQIYQRPIVRIPTNKPNIRRQLPTRMFATAAQKYDAAVARVLELNDRGSPVLVGTKTVWASEEISKRLAAAGRPHRVLNAAQNEQEATIVAEAGQPTGSRSRRTWPAAGPTSSLARAWPRRAGCT
jgi:preprotein translocase subunit SecA